MSDQPGWKSCGLYEMYVAKDGHVYYSPAADQRFVCVLCGATAPDCDEIVRHFLFECEAARGEWE